MAPWEKIYVRMPKWLMKAVDKEAELRAMDRSDYVRQALLNQLKADGVEPDRKNYSDTHGV
jgi:metal-responsive CopG/Arc/MetJ family transcriptional regulator